MKELQNDFNLKSLSKNSAKKTIAIAKLRLQMLIKENKMKKISQNCEKTTGGIYFD